MQENISIKGEITGCFHDQTSLNRLEKAFNRLVLALRDRFPSVMRFYRLGRLKKKETIKNVVCNAGLNAIARRLCNDTTYTGYINKMALGTGSATPAASDTQLVTESYRNTTASGTSSSNISYLTAYFTETECDGTYTEFGNFIDGTGTANSGKLWSHISVSWTKANTEVLVVSCKYTFASA